MATSSIATRLSDFSGRSVAGGRYSDLTRLGEGSMGAVYRARDTHLDCDVVLKVPTVSTLEDPEFMERFRREVRYLTKLAHPHIVTIMDVGEDEGIPFLVMPHLSGGHLGDRPMGSAADARGRMFPESLKLWLMEIAKALDFLHGQGYVHRDVKPANILFDEHGHPFLSDFGLVKVLTVQADERNSSLTGAGMVVGTPNYIAPEIVMGVEYDGRTDQYSLAMTIYEALCGRNPVEGPTPSATLVNQTTVTPPPLRDVVPGIPAALSAAIARGIAKKPAQRFPSCVTFAEAVLCALPAKRAPAAATGRVTAASSGAAAGAKVRNAVPHRSATKKGSLSSKRQMVSHGTPGRVPCPVCHKPIPLKPNYAGKRGHCQTCHAYLQISDDIASLKVVAEESSDTSKSSSATRGGMPSPSRAGRQGSSRPSSAADASPAAQSDVILLGETAFGFKLNKSVQLTLAGLMLIGLIAASIFVGIQYTRPSADDVRKVAIENAPVSRESD